MPISITGMYVLGTNDSEVLHGSNWGHDTIFGFRGADSLFGYAGNDTLIGGIDGFNDYINGGDGKDTVDYTETNLNMTIDLGEGTARTDTQWAVASSAPSPFGTLMYYHQSKLEDTLVSIENVDAGEGHDTIFGSNVDNVLYGNGGNDEMNGMGGNDALNGGAGRDKINGGDGQDVLTGGADKDVFVFDNAWHVDGDFITDFVTGEDMIDVSEIDANPFQFGNQAFDFSENGFTGKAGQLARIDAMSSKYGEVWGGDLDGDRSADFYFEVNVTDGPRDYLIADDFLL